MADDRNPLNPKTQGIKLDPKKDYRWVRKDRIEERKENDGFDFVKGKSSSDEGRVKSRGLTLMERNRELADESARRKEIKTRQMTESYKEKLGQEVEQLSRRSGIDLHKVVKHLDKD